MMPGRAFGDCRRHFGMFRGGTKGREWEGVHESSVHVSVHLCVRGSEQPEWGCGSQELICPGARNRGDPGSRGSY